MRKNLSACLVPACLPACLGEGEKMAMVGAHLLRLCASSSSPCGPCAFSCSSPSCSWLSAASSVVIPPPRFLGCSATPSGLASILNSSFVSPNQCSRRNAGAWTRASAANFEVPSLATVAVASAMSFGLLRVFIYFRLEYIIAAMLEKHVPRGNSRVLDLGIHEGRNFYYYPNDVKEVVAISSNQSSQVVKNQALRAGVQADIRSKPFAILGFPSNSMDAVISIHALCDVMDDEIKEIICEAVRVLKPGKPFIFVENVKAEWLLVRLAQTLLQITLRALGYRCNATRDILQYLQGVEGLEELKYEYIFGFQDPHIVGLARKQLAIGNTKMAVKKKVTQPFNAKQRK
eukprot:c18642_g1_i1 orf=271-1308(-)